MSKARVKYKDNLASQCLFAFDCRYIALSVLVFCIHVFFVELLVPAWLILLVTVEGEKLFSLLHLALCHDGYNRPEPEATKTGS